MNIKWTNCEVCDCRYAATLMSGKPIVTIRPPCPAERIARTGLGSEGKLWEERALKHHPEWR